MRTLFLLLLGVGPLVAGEPLAARVEALARPYVESGKLAGVVVGVLDAPGGEPVIAGYGAGAPGRDTVYEIGSVSKVFTGVLLAAMVNDGTVRLDQPVAALLPAGVTVPARGERNITLLDLATHRSGLPRMPDNFRPQDPANPYADYTPAMMYAFLSTHRLRRAPGAQFEYSNLGGGLLGHALARRAGQSYEELLKARITGPLGMESTVVTLTPALQKRLAPGHDFNGKRVARWDIPTLAGAGGIRSTAADLMRFLRANLAGAPAPLDAALALARKVHFAPGPPRLGLLWHISPRGVHWHNGQTGGYHSFVAIDTKRGLAVLVLSNSAVPAVDQLGGQLLRLLAGEKVEPLAVRKEVSVAPATLARYAGTYRLFAGFALTVTVEDGGLMVQATGQPKFRVFAASDTEFFYKAVDAQITFQKDGAGKVTGLILRQNGTDHRGEKQ